MHTKLPGQLRDRDQADLHVEAAYPEPSFSNVLVPAPESERPPLLETNEWKQHLTMCHTSSSW